MKTLYIYLILLALAISSCDDVVDVELKDDPQRLVVEALINWEKGTIGNNQTISLRKSSPFFKQEVINAIGATVLITNENGTEFPFTETAPGIYTTSTFTPELGAEYTLTINYEDENYQATEKMIPVPSIKRVEQRVEEFGGEKIPIGAYYFDDPSGIKNFYLDNIKPDFQPKKDALTFDDEFTDGNELELLFTSDYEDPENDDEIREYNTGDVIEIKLFGISEQFLNYYDILNEQSDASGGPFSLAPAEAKGNCINLTNPNKPAFGYFRLSEVSTEVYIYK